MNSFTTDPIYPGETLAENLEYLKISQKELAIRTGLSEKHISQIINGIASITPESALRLEMALGISASFWNSLEKNYREEIAKIEQKKRVASETIYLKNFSCYKDLAKLGYVKDTLKKAERVNALLDFFKVNSLMAVPSSVGVKYRKTGSNKVHQNEFCLAAWLRCGQIEATKTKIAAFDEKIVKKNLGKLRRLTKDIDFEERLIEICQNIGIHLVFLPKFSKTTINGATFWFKGNPVIQLNNKGKKRDILWFTFFHELGHVLLHSKKSVFIDSGKTHNIVEKEADEFAAEALITKKEYQEWKKRIHLSNLTPDSLEIAIHQFAKQQEVSSDIIAGRIAYNEDRHWSEVAHLRKNYDPQ